MDTRSHDSTQIAIITGSAGGLGKEFARRLLSTGEFKVCLSDINEKLGKETLGLLASEFGQGNVHFVRCNVTSLEAVTHLWTETCAHFDVDNVNLLVNNAGVMGEKEGWQKCIDINLCGVLNGTTVALDKSTNWTTVVNVASILGLFCAQQPKGWAYNTSKSAVVTASRCIGANTNKSVKVLCLCPSVAATPILEGCTEQELQEMRTNVGGFMSVQQVGDAFMGLLSSGKSGDVMAVWKDSPPYLIPDTGMALFILYTTCAMMFRFVPKGWCPTCVKPWPHMTFCLLLIPLSWVLLGKLALGLWQFFM